MAFNNNGMLLASGSADSTIKQFSEYPVTEDILLWNVKDATKPINIKTLTGGH